MINFDDELQYRFLRVLQAVQKLIDEEFQGIVHLRTSTLHKKISSAPHDFIRLSGSENKLEALLQLYFGTLACLERSMEEVVFKLLLTLILKQLMTKENRKRMGQTMKEFLMIKFHRVAFEPMMPYE